ncbi:MAG: NHL repeat-containing protein [Chthoniobacterales bacterium]
MKFPFAVAFATGLALVSTLRADFTNNQSADLVLGQADFASSGAATTQTGLNFVRDVAIDAASGKVFVADYVNNRVLRYASSASLANGAAAEAVFGQADFVSGGAGTAQNRMDQPTGVCVDSDGRLWVADQDNNRVLRFENAATKPSTAPADGVLGQLLFSTNASAAGALGMNGPAGVAVDTGGTLWVADRTNNRVLRFDNAAVKLNGGPADGVLGQPDFATVTAATSDVKMSVPLKLAVSTTGVLWVAEQNSRRVIRFDDAAAKANGAAANGVLGQPDFNTNTAGLTAAKMSFATGVAVDSSGTVYASDYSNNRVLIFLNAAAKANGADADKVLGQPDFVTGTATVSATGMEGPQGLGLDSAGRLYVSLSLQNRVTRYSPPKPVDNTPTISVTGGNKKTTHKTSITLRGTATSPAGILKVQYRINNKGTFKAAQGTSSWRLKINKLKLGTIKVNLVVVATDGTAATRTITVKRSP